MSALTDMNQSTTKASTTKSKSTKTINPSNNSLNASSFLFSSSTSTISNKKSRLIVPSGFNNLNVFYSINSLKIHWKWSKCERLRISMFLCFLLLVDSSMMVVAYPAPAVSAFSRSTHHNSAKSVQSTTHHSLQSVDSGSSLSIVSSIDVLRQNIMLEIMRKHIRHAKQRQLQSNKEFLDRIG